MRWGAYSAPPELLAGFGPLCGWGKRLSWGRGGKLGGEGEVREGNEGEGKGGPQVTVEPGPLRALLRH